MNPTTIRFASGDLVADDLALLEFAAFLAETAREHTRSLVVSWLDADERLVPAIVPIDDVPLQPDTQMFAALSRILDDMLVEHAPGGSVVLVLARPGSGADGERPGLGLRAAYASQRSRTQNLRRRQRRGPADHPGRCGVSRRTRKPAAAGICLRPRAGTSVKSKSYAAFTKYCAPVPLQS